MSYRSETIKDVEKDVISRAFDFYDGNIVKTASALGVSRAGLYRKLKEYELYPRPKKVTFIGSRRKDARDIRSE